MKKALAVLASVIFLASAYVWFSGIRFSLTPSLSITAVKLYATEAEANAEIGGKYNSVRLRCDDPSVEGWTGEFSLFDPPL
ncbi:hypothetical protein [Cupriavidus taiwanensis]|uniref:hypothetical protein n=1 Tax=Cupriavidus taiwanensis TaxID=164546 RepID=UPI000E10BA5A|nr:hypothetical protein [Cupriavidus taiwanensis]SOY67290.1 exported hypothetical protein [Cupriavidus taiwanensis]SOY67550.1 exported hypothetical protein [Cupriavidus taiwanensis]SOY94910.1 exported hypothetical protein [Cupriavidus taiwanensis]SOZ71858.1 exported hypothetical protein [Cupriavidus taiwanensis]SOZ87160.1 exported hypothetical protein [Cupriavidus taiwanensis]